MDLNEHQRQKEQRFIIVLHFTVISHQGLQQWE